MSLSADTHHRGYFVIAAIVAAELHKAMLVAREISLTASNARALALRAGHGAAGFRALTDFIDELASKTVSASRDINNRAITMSRLASETARLNDALKRLDIAVNKAEGAAYRDSIDAVVNKTRSAYKQLQEDYNFQIYKLTSDLDELARELRTATVLAAMSRVEASASGKEFEGSLNVIASNVAESAEKIQMHVKASQRLFGDISNRSVIH